jgi:hypothetical protein
VEVISFLLKEFLQNMPKTMRDAPLWCATSSPVEGISAKHAKDNAGCTPLMCYLISRGPRDSDALECLSPGKMEFIGDPTWPLNCWREIDDGTIKVRRAVCWLDNHNPSLRAI